MCDPLVLLVASLRLERHCFCVSSTRIANRDAALLTCGQMCRNEVYEPELLDLEAIKLFLWALRACLVPRHPFTVAGLRRTQACTVCCACFSRLSIFRGFLLGLLYPSRMQSFGRIYDCTVRWPGRCPLRLASRTLGAYVSVQCIGDVNVSYVIILRKRKIPPKVGQRLVERNYPTCTSRPLQT